MSVRQTPAAALRDAVGVLGERRTYRHLLYLLLAMPLGFFYYLLATLFVFGAVLSVVLVGVPVLLGCLLAARRLADGERRLANRLLGTRIPAGDGLPSVSEDGVRAAVAALLTADDTWRGVAFLLVKSFLGFAAWLAFLVVGLTAVVLLTAPVAESASVGGWTIDTLPERLLAVPLGVAVTVAAAHALNFVADKTGVVAASLLGEQD